MADKKTKEELIKEIETAKTEIAELKEMLKEIEINTQKIGDLRKEMMRLEKYKQYEESANEIYVIKESFVNAGFTDEKALMLLLKVIDSASSTPILFR